MIIQAKNLPQSLLHSYAQQLLIPIVITRNYIIYHKWDLSTYRLILWPTGCNVFCLWSTDEVSVV